MEVLGNSSELKESEKQNPEVNYNYNFPKDITLGVEDKGEIDVSLLVACKLQLSSEVIRWKTETLRLQKERDSAQLQHKKLDQIVEKLVDRARELEDRLMQAEEENRQMKSSVSVDKERACLAKKLNYNINKCSSLESSVKFEGSHFQALEQRKLQFSPQEDWREVSQKMLQQMKNEMKELQEMSVQYQTSEKENVLEASSEMHTDCKEEIKVELSNLLCEAQSMKHDFFHQRHKLESICDILSAGRFPEKDEKSRDTDSSYADVQNVTSSYSRRMSAEDYHFHFSKKLLNTSDAKKMARKVKRFLKNPDLCVHQKDPTVATGEQQSPELSHCSPDEAEEALEVKTDDSEKVCPICQISFRASVSQADFEEHVVNHLERESASLLDQYVIV